MNNQEFNPREVVVNRTLSSTLFETAAAIILIVTWVLTIREKGIDSFLIPAMSTVSVVYILVSCYKPKWLYRGTKMPKSLHEMEMEINTARALAVAVAFLFLATTLFKDTKNDWVIELWIVVIIALKAYSYFRAKRYKKRKH